MVFKVTNSNAESDKQNLYEELVDLLKRHGKCIDDISWVECMDYPKDSEPMRCSIPIDNFIAIAMNTWYDPYEWSIQIPMSLRIYGNERSFLIEVHEYDGRQNLSYVNMELTEPVESRIIKSLMVEDGDYEYKPIWADEN